MKRKIKKGITYAESKEADTKIKRIVESIINSIVEGGDEVIRSLSMKFDKWSPESFKVSKETLQEIIEDLPQQVIDDIRFAQTQIKNFAEKQK
jgi:sulfopropanediol 3-dehydrogenase